MTTSIRNWCHEVVDIVYLWNFWGSQLFVFTPKVFLSVQEGFRALCEHNFIHPVDLIILSSFRKHLGAGPLKASHGPKNMLSVQHWLELLCSNNRLPNQLLLSSEIGPFEDQPCKNHKNQYNPYQMDLSRSSLTRGVGWVNGCCRIVIRASAAR